ncbi:recombinase family protein [Paraburkholderia youngii]|uniref:recombinase family protein n=1 Tax=Paraburkholderia youngii TaxID=2782701 RepID=UPI003D1FD31C
MSEGQRIGYVRVSTVDQNSERQLDGVALDKVFTDKASGKDTKRPHLQLALDYLREDDSLIVHSMDRLARNAEDLLRMVRELTSRGVSVEFVKERLTFSGNRDDPMGNLMMTMLAGVAQFERALIRERQREGIALAKAKGNVYKGRKPSLTKAQIAEVRQRAAKGESKVGLAASFGVARQTIYNALRHP